LIVRRIVVLVVVTACGGGAPESPSDAADSTDARADAATPSIDLGVTWTPIGYPAPTAQDRMAFYTGHAAYGNIIAVHRPWRQDRASAGAADPFVTPIASEATTYGFELMYGYGFSVDVDGPDLTSDSEPSNNTWTNAETRDKFCAVGVAWVTAYHPRYIFLGNEMDGYYRAHPADWPNWLSELATCRDLIHAASPHTLVFTTYQLEFTKGTAVKTGRDTTADWTPITDVANAVDGIGFTSYPYFHYESPADMPATYYTEIADHTSKPVLFTELGWVANAAIPWTGSDADQAAFVDRFFGLIPGLDVRYAVYLTANDWPTNIVDSTSPFFEIGLRDSAGAARPADAAWRAQVAAH
jgi:hypothetical protein